MGGKTSALEAVEKEFGDRITAVPEASSCILKKAMPRPGRDIAWSEKWSRAFQNVILPLQREMEFTWGLVAEERASQMLLMDRGMMDGAAYMPGGIEPFIKTFGLDIDEVYDRYDTIIHLETVAKTRPDLFGKTGNPDRYETKPEDAVALDEALQKVWKQHPNWILVPSELGIEGVVNRVIEIVSDAIDWEMELKFKLPGMPRLPFDHGTIINQGYLLVDDVELRIRQKDEQCFMTVKDQAMVSRREWERPIPRQIFDSLWPKTSGRRVQKVRLCSDYNGHILEIDQYLGTLSGLFTLEVEFRRQKDMDSFVLPPWAFQAIDVTNDPRYKNRNLAIHGLPPEAKL